MKILLGTKDGVKEIDFEFSEECKQLMEELKNETYIY
jgi:hypothetical protein